MKILLDSNIIIYSSKPENTGLREKLKSNLGEFYVSAVSLIEVLGYHLITERDKKDLEVFFSNTFTFPIDSIIIETAVKLRQKQKLSLGDSIIAATALFNSLELWTNNTADFSDIEGLKLYNPL